MASFRTSDYSNIAENKDMAWRQLLIGINISLVGCKRAIHFRAMHSTNIYNHDMNIFCLARPYSLVINTTRHSAWHTNRIMWSVSKFSALVTQISSNIQFSLNVPWLQVIYTHTQIPNDVIGCLISLKLSMSEIFSWKACVLAFLHYCAYVSTIEWDELFWQHT